MEKRIFFLLLISLAGIFFLLLLSLIIPPKTLKINQITEKNLNQQIQIQAKIISITDFPKSEFQILTLKDETGNITATSNSNRQLKINQSKIYMFTGKIQEYENEIQLSIDKIQKK
jgi:DNA/RNA endonuclease YhcR with UshA esterase domain